MVKHMHCCLRSVLRLCTAFALVFSVTFSNCADVVRADTKQYHEYEIGELVEYTDTPLYTGKNYKVCVAKFYPVSGWFYGNDNGNVSYTVTPDDLSDGIKNIGSSYTVDFGYMPAGHYSVHARVNYWQTLHYNGTNIASYNANFNSRIASYDCSLNKSGASLTVPNSYHWTGASGYFEGGNFWFRSQVYQPYNFTAKNAASNITLTTRFVAEGYSVVLFALMSEEEYSAYMEKLEENKKWEEEKELLEESNKLQQDANDLQEEANETSKGILDSVTDFFGSFFENIANAIAGLFIPEDGYFDGYFARLNDFFSEKLGFLYAPIGMLLDFLELLQNASVQSPTIAFPELKFQEYVIMEKQTIDLDQLYGDNFWELRSKMYFVSNVILYGAVLRLLQSKLREVLKN